MGERPLVSIIIPVHNGALTLRRCLRSVLRQTWRDIEVLLVNNASTDDSLALCQTFAAADRRVTVMDTAVPGVSHARNLGLRQARGKYLQFVDCDDWLAGDATEQLAGAAEADGCDLVVADFIRVSAGLLDEKGHITAAAPMTKESYALWMMLAPANYYYGVLWNKLYRRAVVEEADLTFDTGLSWCEDFIFNLAYLRHCGVIRAISAPVYYYVKNANSLVHTQTGLKNTKKMLQVKGRVFEEYRRFYQDLGLYESHRSQVNSFLLAVAQDDGVHHLPRPPKSGEGAE